MGCRRLLKLAGLALAGLFLFLGLVYCLIPVGRIATLIDRNLSSRNLTMTPEPRKTLLPGLAWKRPLLSSPRGALVGCDTLALRLRLLPLLAGRLRLGGEARLGDGRIALEYGLNGKELLALEANGINLADVPLFRTLLAARVDGTLAAGGRVLRGADGANGRLRLEVPQLAFSGVRLGGIPLPDASRLRCRGTLAISNDRLRLESLSLQGDGLFMRLSGALPAAAEAPLDLVLEIMPKADFMERQKAVFLLLSRFMVSPGNYRIPIRGTVLKPEVF